jgi:hypothetical protein
MLAWRLILSFTGSLSHSETQTQPRLMQSLLETVIRLFCHFFIHYLGHIHCDEESREKIDEIFVIHKYLTLWSTNLCLRIFKNTVPKSRYSAVGIVTGYWLDDRGVGVRVPVGPRIFTFPCRSDGLWGPPNLLYNGHQGLFPGGKAAGAWS